jgi:hypothetical protein
MTSRQSDRPSRWSLGNDPDKRLGGTVRFGCSLDDLQVEAEKAARELSDVAAKIAVELPK